MTRLASPLLALVALLSLEGCGAPPAQAHAAGEVPAPSAAPSPSPASDAASAPHGDPEATQAATGPTTARDPKETLVAWFRSKLPPGGEVTEEPVGIVHTAKAGETLEAIAGAYLDFTTIYLRGDLVEAIRKENGLGKRALSPNTRLKIPALLDAPYETGDRARLPPAGPDEPMRGVYIRGDTAARAMYLQILDRMAERGMNAIVLDAKDYDGLLTYPSKVPLAIEGGAVKRPPIRDFARAIRFAHDRGIRVLARISCFEDEIMAKAKPALSVQAKWGRAYPIGWLDPSNEGAQNYIIDLVKEAIDAGADEIQLDYVRYPVLGIKGADFKLEERKLTQTVVIRDFVRRVHEVTQARKLPLSLDVFGVVAFGKRVDIDALGQDPAMLATECEALSPMVYPSHYSKGFRGWDEPGDHPEIVGIGTKAIRELIASELKDPEVKTAAIRPWLQAMNYKSPTYSPKYLAEEIKSGDAAGGFGWLMWNPGQNYGYAWTAVPKKRATATADAKGAPPPKAAGSASAP